MSNLIKQHLGHIGQGLMGEFAVVTLIAFGSSVKELAWVLMCDHRLRNRNNYSLMRLKLSHAIKHV